MASRISVRWRRARRPPLFIQRCRESDIAMGFVTRRPSSSFDGILTFLNSRPSSHASQFSGRILQTHADHFGRSDPHDPIASISSKASTCQQADATTVGSICFARSFHPNCAATSVANVFCLRHGKALSGGKCPNHPSFDHACFSLSSAILRAHRK